MVSWCLLLVAALSRVVIVVPTDGGEDGTGDESCNATCTYTAWAQDASCRNRGLTIIPTDCGPCEMMDLRNNLLKDIQPGALGSYPMLRYLDLEFNQIGSVTAGAFRGCISLENIYFQYNELAEVGEGAFEGATSLQRLFLNQNSITSFHPDAFRGLGSLVRLYMGNNDLRELHPSVFRHTPLLEFLHLGDNKLDSLPEEIFRPLSHLTFLNLEVNNLMSISAAHLQHLGNLQELYLAGNQIVSVAHLPNMPNLNILDLSGNDIRDVGELAEKIGGLEQLYLSGNSHIICSCSALAVGQWIRDHKDDSDVDAAKVNAMCDEPSHLSGRALYTLTKKILCPRRQPLTSITTYAPVKSKDFKKDNDGKGLPETPDQGRNQGWIRSILEQPTTIYVILGVGILIVIVLIVTVLIKCLGYHTERYRRQNTRRHKDQEYKKRQQQLQQLQRLQQQRNATNQQMVIDRNAENEDPLYEPVEVRPPSPTNDSAFGSEDDIAQAGRAQSMDSISFPIPPRRPDHSNFNSRSPAAGSLPPSEESSLLAQERPNANPSRRGGPCLDSAAVPNAEGSHYPQQNQTSPYVTHSMLRQKLQPRLPSYTLNARSPIPLGFTSDRTPGQTPDYSPEHIPNYRAPTVLQDQTVTPTGNEHSAFLDLSISCV